MVIKHNINFKVANYNPIQTSFNEKKKKEKMGAEGKRELYSLTQLLSAATCLTTSCQQKNTIDNIIMVITCRVINEVKPYTASYF